MNEAVKQYSLWLMPKEGSVEHQKLTDLIKKYSRQFSAPEFDPHVTLLANVSGEEEEIISQTEKLAKFVTPYSLQLGVLDYTDLFFQCLVARAVATSEAIAANKKARDIFGRHEESLYVPHLSLLYGTNIPQEAKLQIIAEIGDQLQGLTFPVNSIYIYTSGEVTAWRRIAKISLTGRA